MGNGIFRSEMVKGLQGECTHPPPDVFLRVFRSNLREVSLDSVASCTSEAFNNIFQIGFEIRLMPGIVLFSQMLAQTRKQRPSGLPGIIYQSTVYELKIKTAGSK